MGCCVSGDKLQYRLEESVSHRRARQVTQLFTYLLTHKLYSSCIRRYLVSRPCDWAMSPWIFKISNFNGWTVKMVELRHCAKFRRNRTNCGRDIVIFQFFKMATAAIVDFINFQFLTVKRVVLRHHAKFRRNRSSYDRYMTMFRFFQDGGRPPS